MVEGGVVNNKRTLYWILKGLCSCALLSDSSDSEESVYDDVTEWKESFSRISKFLKDCERAKQIRFCDS